MPWLRSVLDVLYRTMHYLGTHEAQRDMHYQVLSGVGRKYFPALITSICLALASTASGQGTISFDGGPIYIGQIGGPLASPANGPWLAALYGAPLGSPVSSMVNLSGAPVSIGATVPGNVNGTGFPIPFPLNTQVSLQVRAWHASFGSTWDAIPGVQLDGSTPGTGLSMVVPITIISPLPNLGGAFYPMAISPIPEPSTIAFGLFGLATLTLLRKRTLNRT
jgi:hypothetical protein